MQQPHCKSLKELSPHTQRLLEHKGPSRHATPTKHMSLSDQPEAPPLKQEATPTREKEKEEKGVGQSEKKMKRKKKGGEATGRVESGVMAQSAVVRERERDPSSSSSMSSSSPVMSDSLAATPTGQDNHLVAKGTDAKSYDPLKIRETGHKTHLVAKETEHKDQLVAKETDQRDQLAAGEADHKDGHLAGHMTESSNRNAAEGTHTPSVSSLLTQPEGQVIHVLHEGNT